MSNSPCAAFSYAMDEMNGCFRNTHPNESYDEALRIRQLGEATYNHVRFQQGLGWIRNNPDRFLSLTTQRFVAFPLPNASGNPLQQPRLSRSEWITYLSTLLSVPGLMLMWGIKESSRRALDDAMACDVSRWCITSLEFANIKQVKIIFNNVSLPAVICSLGSCLVSAINPPGGQLC